jgi:hypothetical protein
VNYLEICQRIVADYGIAGGTGPSTVAGQTGELRNIVNWVADAAEHVDNEWLDWKYLWCRYAETMVVSSYTAPQPSSGTIKVRLWNPRRMKIREPGGLWVELEFIPREEFEDTIEPSTETARMPDSFTINPDNSITLNCPADIAYELKGEYWRRPVRLAVNGDIPLIPAEHWRVIVARALIQYGDREDAPETISGAGAELLTAMEKLEADQLEDQERRRSSTDRLRPPAMRGFPL